MAALRAGAGRASGGKYRRETTRARVCTPVETLSGSGVAVPRTLGLMALSIGSLSKLSFDSSAVLQLLAAAISADALLNEREIYLLLTYAGVETQTGANGRVLFDKNAKAYIALNKYRLRYLFGMSK